MKYNLAKGQALITLIFITIIGITVAVGAAMLVVINSQSGVKFQQSLKAYQIAQSGAENSLLRLLRDPAYSGEVNLQVGDGLVDIVVSSASGYYTATASGRIGNFIRKIQINAHHDSDYRLIIDSRKEIF